MSGTDPQYTITAARTDPTTIEPPERYMLVLLTFRNTDPAVFTLSTHDEALTCWRGITDAGGILDEWMYYTQCLINDEGNLEGEMDVRYSEAAPSRHFAYLDEQHLIDLQLLPQDFLQTRHMA